MNFPYLGETAAIATAMLWGVSVILFRVGGKQISPMAMNLFKNVLGTTLLACTLLLVGASASGEDVYLHAAILFLSGVVGVGIADTLFFQSLGLVGAGWTGIVECLYSPSIILFAFLILGETLTPIQIVGGGLILFSFVLPVFFKSRHDLPFPQLVRGLVVGSISMVLMGISIVVVKPILESHSVIWSTTLRMSGGAISLAVASLFMRNGRKAWAGFRPQPVWKVLIPGSILGAYLTFILWITGFKYAAANVVSLLNQTSTLFIVLFATLFLHEKMTPPKAGAIVLAVVGSLLVLV